MSQSTLKQTLDNVIQLFERKPEKALFTYEAKTESGEGLDVKARAQQFEFQIDVTEEIGGGDQASSPTEYALAALGACHSIVYKILALREGIDVEEVRVNLKAQSDTRGFFSADSSLKPGFQNIDLETSIAADATEEQLKNILQRVEKLCPVNDIIANPVSVTGKVTLQNSRGETVSI